MVLVVYDSIPSGSWLRSDENDYCSIHIGVCDCGDDCVCGADCRLNDFSSSSLQNPFLCVVVAHFLCGRSLPVCLSSIARSELSDFICHYK